MTDQPAQEESAQPEVSVELASDSTAGLAADVEHTAGAVATADDDGDIILEDITSAEELALLYEESFKHIQEGEIVRGRIVMIGRDSVLVDLKVGDFGLVQRVNAQSCGGAVIGVHQRLAAAQEKRIRSRQR